MATQQIARGGKKVGRSVSVLTCIAFFGFFCFWLMLAGMGPCFAGDQGAEPLKIARITPSGADVPASRQIVFEFNRPVVPLGKMGRSASEIPITITPALSCQWRWLSPATLACQLDEQHAMVPATRYQVTVEPGIRSEDGAELAEPVTHSFITKRPKISSAWFVTWRTPVVPLYRVQTDQPVEKASLEAHLYFQVEGGARTAARVVEDTKFSKSAPRETVWIVGPAGELPADKACLLAVEPGVVSKRGPEPGVEKRKLADFQTIPQFRFQGIQCKDLKGADLILPPDGAGQGRGRCSPATPIALLFSSPVRTSALQDKLKIATAKGEPPLSDVWQEGDYSRLNLELDKGKKYEVYLEESAFSPFTEYRLKAGAGSLKDEFGRSLAKGIDMRLPIDHRPPDLHLFKNIFVLEKELDTDLPILATNLDRIDMRYETLTAAGKSPSATVALPGPRTRDVTAVVPLGVRKLLGGKSGIVTGAISTKPAVREQEYAPRWFVAQVTPFHVHVKLGHYNTLVWVTDLATGLPVPDVEVHIRKSLLKNLDRAPEILADGRTGSDGTAELPGTSKLDPALQHAESYRADTPWFFIWCRKGEDVSLMPLRYDFQVDAEGSNHDYIPSWTKSRHGHIRAWGATAQGIYKVGDTVQYKIYVRDQENRRFVPPPSSIYRLRVIDPAGKVIHQRDDITLSDFGAFDGEFPIPKNAAVGYYQFQATCSFAKLDLAPMQVLVSDFTPSPFKVSTELNGKIFGAGQEVAVSVQARLHSGGPYGKADTRVTATVETQDLRPSNPLLRGFRFDVLKKDEDEEIQRGAVQTVFQTQAKLDDGGNLETRFTLVENPVVYGRLNVESSVRDDRGKSVADRSSAVYFGRDRYVGLMQDEWLLQEGKAARVKFVVIDQNGNIVPGVKTRIKVEKLETKAARVRGAGDAYPTQYEKEWVETEDLELSSAGEPGVFEFTPQQSGTVRFSAEVTDSAGRAHKTAMQRWVTGKSRVVWESREGNLLNVYAEKEEYRVGDTAKFLVQNPYPGAKALITVERFGTIDRWVKTFENSTEVVEIPVQPDYLPGFYLSVMVMSPRVEKPLGPGGEDLGKPVFRMGYAKIEVKDQYKEILVQCKSDKEVYKPRETVELEFDARPRNAAADGKSQPIELAVTVLDEAVFDLLKQKRQAFDPYQGFYHFEDLDLQNYNLLMQLVGREKYEKKGASPAAGAGFDLSMRSVFKFVSYWNPSLRVDGDGKAKVRFQLPDNLTGWRVLAMAVTPGDRMGLGEGAFKVNQSTEIRPVMPNQVLEGDTFSAGFSVMNRTGNARNLEVKIRAEGRCAPLEGGPAPGAGGFETTQTISAEPYKRYTVRLPMKATGAGEIVLTAQAGDQSDRDGMRHTLKVLGQKPQEVAAAYGSIVSGEASEKIAFPADMRPEASLVSVVLSASIIGGMDGVVTYMKEYPHECWEQKLSRAVLAGAFPKMVPYLPETVTWEKSASVAEKALMAAAEFQAPNGGMAFYLSRDAYVSPYLSAFTALAFGWLRGAGHAPPAPVEEKLQKYLLEFLKRDEKKSDLGGGAVADVRAVALSALAGRNKISRADLERHWKDFPQMSLFGKANFLEALIKTPDTANMRGEAVRDILSHADQSGGSIRFTSRDDSSLRWVLSSEPRDNSAILMALLAARAADPGAAAALGDIPVRLMRSISTGRKSREHWASTQENVYAAMAALRYSTVYEASSPNMSARVKLDDKVLGEARFESPAAKPAQLDYSVRESDLGRKTAVIVSKEGDGRLYYSTRLAYAPVETSSEAVNAGIEVHREYSVERNGRWVLLENPLEIKTGELVRVDLFISLPAERYFVVVDDPVPGGLEPVNRDLATASEVDTAKADALHDPKSLHARYADWRTYGVSRWSFYHRELRHDSARFYSERLSPGRYYLSYTAQAIAPGRFAAMPARAEEMYDPDVFGRSLPAQFTVKQAE